MTMQTPERSDLLPALADLAVEQFETTALSVFRYQAHHNQLYARYLELLGRSVSDVQTLSDIPFLPIQFFKQHQVLSGLWTPQTAFLSSSTTGQTPSQHLVRDLDFYLHNTRRGFEQFYGDPSDWCVLALLPSYLERSGSSLVAMADYFIRLSRFPESGFFLHDLAQLSETLSVCRSNGYKTLLLGVSFALLDFAEQFPMDLSGITIMETGGMKGRRKELTRTELHQNLDLRIRRRGHPRRIWHDGIVFTGVCIGRTSIPSCCDYACYCHRDQRSFLSGESGPQRRIEYY